MSIAIANQTAGAQSVLRPTRKTQRSRRVLGYTVYRTAASSIARVAESPIVMRAAGLMLAGAGVFALDRLIWIIVTVVENFAK